MLDTDVASYLIKGLGSEYQVRPITDTRAENRCVSAITRGELLYGLARLPKRHWLHLAVKKFLAAVQVLAWPPEAAEFYAAIPTNSR